jgi:isopentenyl diphosphate isomerase/L-lactate dehydrogenase-like FMN-dependent dehydrogenase
VVPALSLREFRTPDQWAAAAQRLLPHHIWTYISGGAFDELCLRRNRWAFEQLALRPGYPREAAPVDLTTTVLGSEISLPVMLSPASQQINVHPDAEAATARGAGDAGTLMIVPFSVGERLERTAEAATGPLWLNVYHDNRGKTQAMVERAAAAGYRALCVTADNPMPFLKEGDRRAWYLMQFQEVRFALHEDPFPDLTMPMRALTWDELAWFREITSLPIVLKGIVTAEDAHLAVEHGVDAVFVSNHGGRMIDAQLATIEVLPEVVDAVAGRAEVYLDSGIRRGTDAVKALALGARAVGIGRPWYWGLALGGSDGVRTVLEQLREEVAAALRYCGCSTLTDIDRRAVTTVQRTPAAL